MILEELGLGRAHHRALHFIGRNPGITVSELLAILRITKQSLARVLGALVDQGYVAQAQGDQDRRQRLLTLTPAGQALERRLFERQRARLAVAYRDAGAAAVDGFPQRDAGHHGRGGRRNIAETHAMVPLSAAASGDGADRADSAAGAARRTGRCRRGPATCRRRRCGPAARSQPSRDRANPLRHKPDDPRTGLGLVESPSGAARLTPVERR